MIIDFEGEPARSLGQRRLKRPAAVDLAGMIRSFHYASQGGSAAARAAELGASLDPAPRVVADPLVPLGVGHLPRARTSRSADGASFLPVGRGASWPALLDFFLLEKAVYELGYEANSRPDWVDIPARGILDMLDAGP